MNVGTQVKIPDIGPLATVVQTGRNAVKEDSLGRFSYRGNAGAEK